MVGLAFLIGYLNDTLGPQSYHYEDKIVIVDKKYQCPKHCNVHHNHSVYFENESNGMVIDEKKLGKRYKIKKNRQKR
tara:strand:- start:108 stop:338 length:231 start_codon:yes stop_codon:yes gene_type:complete